MSKAEYLKLLVILLWSFAWHFADEKREAKAGA